MLFVNKMTLSTKKKARSGLVVRNSVHRHVARERRERTQKKIRFGPQRLDIRVRV